MEYQSKAPVNVASDLVNQWFDDFYHPTDARFRSEFSREELAWLVQFNAIYDERASSLPDTLTEMHKSVVWEEVMTYASKVLQACDWVGVHARYDR